MNSLIKEWEDFGTFLDELAIRTNSKKKEADLLSLRKDVNLLVSKLKRKLTT